MPYGILKCDQVTFTNAGVDQTISVSGIVASISGNITATGTISGNVIRGGTTISGATVTGTAGQFGTITGNTAGFTTVTGTTVTGTTATFTSGVFTNISGGTHTITSGVFASGTAANPSITFQGDVNTGIYSPGADQVAISTNGTGRLFIDASGRVLAGTSTARSNFFNGSVSAIQQVEGANATDQRMVAQIYGSAAGDSAAYIFAKHRSTSIGGNTIVNNGDTLGLITFQGSDGSEFVPAAYIYAEVDGTPGANDMPGRIVLSTTADGASSPTERLRITSAGLVGVGTSSPANLLNVEGSGTTAIVQVANTSSFIGGTNFTTPHFILRSGNDTTGNVTRLSLLVGTGGQTYIESLLEDGATSAASTVFRNRGTDGVAERMRITSTGRVGIGTTSPGSLLHAAGTTRISNSDGATMLFITHGATTGNTHTDVMSLIGSGGGYGELRTRGSFQTFYIETNEAMRIDASRRLLVGTSTASSAFYSNAFTPEVQIEGSLSLTRRSNDAFSRDFVFAKSAGAGHVLVNNNDRLGFISFQGSDNAKFVQAAAISAFIDGTPGTDDMPGRLVFSTTADGASSPTERMRIGQNGNIAVGTTDTSSYRLNISGNNCVNVSGWGAAIGNGIAMVTSVATSSTAIGFIYLTTEVGTIKTTSTATSYNTSSDYRLKENIVAVTDGITRLQQLKPSRFNFIADPLTTVDGFIAHEVQAVVPEAIHGTKDEVDENGNPIYQGIDQSKLVPLLTAALQEAIGEIESLKARVAALESA